MCGHQSHPLETYSSLETKANENALNYVQRQLSFPAQGSRHPHSPYAAALAENSSASFSAHHVIIRLPPLDTETASFHWLFGYVLQPRNTSKILLPLFSFWLELQLIVYIFSPHILTPLFYTHAHPHTHTPTHKHTHTFKCKLRRKRLGLTCVSQSLLYYNLVSVQRRKKLILENKYMESAW